jgi:hypothetical protein
MGPVFAENLIHASTWAAFLRSQADALPACDFLETITLTGARMYVLAMIEHRTRRIRILGATAHPTAAWMTQATRNLVMDLQDAGCRARWLIRDRDGKFPELFDAVLADAGIEVVLTGVRMPRMNAIMERWIQTCRRELLDRTLICNQRHLLHALHEFEAFYNQHHPHQGIANARPCTPLPLPITDPHRITRLNLRRHQRLGGILNEYQHASRPARMRFSARAGSGCAAASPEKTEERLHTVVLHGGLRRIVQNDADIPLVGLPTARIRDRGRHSLAECRDIRRQHKGHRLLGTRSLLEHADMIVSPRRPTLPRSAHPILTVGTASSTATVVARCRSRRAAAWAPGSDVVEEQGHAA